MSGGVPFTEVHLPGSGQLALLRPFEGKQNAPKSLQMAGRSVMLANAGIAGAAIAMLIALAILQSSTGAGNVFTTAQQLSLPFTVTLLVGSGMIGAVGLAKIFDVADDYFLKKRAPEAGVRQAQAERWDPVQLAGSVAENESVRPSLDLRTDKGSFAARLAASFYTLGRDARGTTAVKQETVQLENGTEVPVSKTYKLTDEGLADSWKKAVNDRYVQGSLKKTPAPAGFFETFKRYDENGKLTDNRCTNYQELLDTLLCEADQHPLMRGEPSLRTLWAVLKSGDPAKDEFVALQTIEFLFSMQQGAGGWISDKMMPNMQFSQGMLVGDGCVTRTIGEDFSVTYSTHYSVNNGHMDAGGNYGTYTIAGSVYPGLNGGPRGYTTSFESASSPGVTTKDLPEAITKPSSGRIMDIPRFVAPPELPA